MCIELSLATTVPAMAVAVSRPRIRDNAVENVFGVYNGDVFSHSLSNFRIQYVVEVRAGGESGFICHVTLYNGDDQGYVLSNILSSNAGYGALYL